MPYYPRKKSYRRKAAPKRKRVYPKKKTSFAKRVQAIMHKQIENKITNDYGANQVLSLAGSTTNPYFLNCCPRPIQGTTQGTRIGNEINVVKATVHGRVNLLPYLSVYNPITCPVSVKMWLCRRRSTNVNEAGTPGTTDFQRFFQLGSGYTGFQSNTLDLVFSPNKDVWTVYAQKSITLSNATLQSTSATITQTNTGCSVPFSFSFAKHLGKLKYNDSDTHVTNKELFLVFQTIPLDGTTYTTATNLAEIHYEIQWTYEDA